MRNQSPHWVEPESSKVTGDHQQLHFSSVTMHAIKGFTLCSSLTPMLYDKAPSRPPVRPNVLSVVCNYYMYRVTPSVAQSTDENHGLLVYYTLHWAFLDVKAVRDNHLIQLFQAHFALHQGMIPDSPLAQASCADKQ
ncbi:hypothetical protein CISG_06955 [Coccidioides immitis RMSCC 3703]|uniref:Uncharacterized protein n=1 Tax=Coccidioides immitis RMSCC 3703 TaxID=454286 RepID=A0A0J8QZ17_COCIT|nr:hypothetical protein CISG_06955 [Coccidioides immitis RMSCC 3703]